MSDPTQERWLPVVGHEGYFEVSNQGRLRSLPRTYPRSGPKGPFVRMSGKILKTQATPDGYRRVRIVRDGIGWNVSIHTLVLTAFVGPRPDGQECRHLNGNPQDNSVANLAWGTSSENSLDQSAHGTHPHGSKTECCNGHPFTEANTYRYTRPDGGPGRGCVECRRRISREYQRGLRSPG